MIEFTKVELTWLEENIKLAMHEKPMPGIAYEIIKKIGVMLDDLSEPKPRSVCDCGDKYHSNGMICARRD